jgi:hypothetical protein
MDELVPPVKRAAEEGWLMRYLSAIVALFGISATLLLGQAVAQVEPPAPPECPIKTAVENTVIARAWHDDVINRRNPARSYRTFSPLMSCTMATWTGINIFRIKCGRIVEVWSEVDAVSRRQQLMGATSANSPR